MIDRRMIGQRTSRWYEVRTGLKSTDVRRHLESFHRFLGDQGAHGGSTLSPERCLELGRKQNPTDDELEADTQAIREALDDMEAGDRGQSVREFLEESCTETVHELKVTSVHYRIAPQVEFVGASVDEVDARCAKLIHRTSAALGRWLLHPA